MRFILSRYLRLTIFAVLFFFSQYGYAQSCNSFDGLGITGGLTNLVNGSGCANNPLIPGTLRILANNVDDASSSANVSFSIDWNDGTAAQIVGPGAPIVYTAATHSYTVDVNHTFPLNGSNSKCVYTPIVKLRIQTSPGVWTLCSVTLGSPPSFIRWNTDDQNSGVLLVSEQATNVTNYLVCAGASTTVIFQDRSTLNCVPPQLTSSPNNIKRWRRFVYGTTNTITSATGVQIGGVVQTYPYNTTGTPTSNVTGSTTLPTPTTSLGITIPADAVVGQYFEITLQAWNFCNQYPAFAPVTTTARITVAAQPTAPVTSTQTVCNGTTPSNFSISGVPNGKTVNWYNNVNASTPHVAGTVGTLITTTTSSGGAATLPVATAFPGFSNTAADNYIVWASYVDVSSSGAINCESPKVAVVRTVREKLDLSTNTITASTSAVCPGDNGITFTLNRTDNPNTQPVGGKTEYIWTVPSNWTIVSGQGTNNITVNLGSSAASGSQTVSVVWQYWSGTVPPYTPANTPVCTSASLTSGTITVRAPIAITTQPSASTICETKNTTFTVVASGTSPTYQWQVSTDGGSTYADVANAGVYSNATTATLKISGATTSMNGYFYRCNISGTCTPTPLASNGVKLTVQPQPSISVQPLAANICADGTAVFSVTAAGQATLTYKWQVSTGGAFSDIANGGAYSGATTSALTVNTNGTGAAYDGYQYQVIVSSTSACNTAVTSIPATINVSGPNNVTINTASASTQSVCSGGTLVLTTSESISNTSFVSGTWTGTFDENFGSAPALISLTNAQIDAILGSHTSGSSTYNPTFNSNGLGAGKLGVYVLTYTVKDDNTPTACTSSGQITINVSKVTAGILYGTTSGTITTSTLAATVCGGVNLYLDGNPSGGSGTYATHAWSIVSSPASPVGSITTTNIQKPVFNYTTPGTYKVKYFVQDNQGCNYDTDINNTDITITVNPTPVGNSSVTTSVVCSNVAFSFDPFVLSVATAAGGNNVTSTYTWTASYDGGVTVVTAGTGSGPIAEKLQNKTSGVLYATYTVTPKAVSGGCTGTSFTIKVPISPEPVVSNTTPSACSNVGFDINPQGNITNSVTSSFTWTKVYDTGITVISAGTGSGHVKETLENKTSGVLKATYTVTAVSTANACASNPTTFTITVNVNPEPVGVDKTVTAACSNVAFSYDPFATSIATAAGGNNVASTFTWTKTYDPGITVVTAGTGTGPVAEKLKNISGGVLNAYYTVTATSTAGSCTATSTFKITVPINSEPVGNASVTTSIVCSSVGFSFDPFVLSVATAAGGNNVASTYTWTKVYDPSLTAVTAGTGSGNIAETLKNQTSGVLYATYTVTPKAVTGGCSGTAFTIKVPISPEPVVSNTTPSACSNVGFDIDPQGNITNGVTSSFTWTKAYDVGINVIIAGTGTGHVKETLENKTSGVLKATYTVTAVSTANSCASSPATFKITVNVNPEPVGVDKTVTAACSSVAFSYDPFGTSIATAAGGNNVASTFTWTKTYDGGISVVTAGTGIGPVAEKLKNTSGGVLNAYYTVTATSTAGSCVATSTFKITVPVNAEANITGQPAATSTCETGSTSTGTFSFGVTATGPGITYQWQEKTPSGSFTNITNGTVGTVTYSNATTATLTVAGATFSMNNNQYRVIMTTTGSCTATSSSAALTVIQLPTVNTPTITNCSDVAGGTTKLLDLTTLNTNVNSGTGLTFTWWLDATATTSPITPGSLPGQDKNYTVNNNDVLYARVHNTTTLCDNIGKVTFIVNTTPIANPITGPGSVCVSPNNVYYQVTQHVGATYKWTVPAGFTVVAGGGSLLGGVGTYTADYFILLNFTSATPPGGLTMSVSEKSSAGCIGASNDKVISVSTSPPLIHIENYPDPTATSFCKSQTGVVFQVPTAEFNPASNYIWTITNPSGAGTDAVIIGSQAGTGLQQIIVNMGTKNSLTIGVTENNVAGCPGTNVPLVVSIVDAPVMTPATASICSGTQPSSQLDLTTLVSQPSTFAWVVKSISTNVTGAFVNDTGTGQITHTPPLKNISGTPGTVVYTVTPTATATPNCMGVPQDYTVTVNPEPVVNAIPDQNFCPSSFVLVSSTSPVASPTLSSNVSGATINWASSNSAVSAGGTLASTGTGTISFTAADNLTGSIITSQVTVTATASGCTSAGANLKTFNLNLLPRPVVTTIPNVEVCSGGSISSISFSSNTGGGETYRWTNSNTAIGISSSGTLNIPGYTAPVNTTGVPIVGTINVFGKLNGCEGPAQTFTITIKPEPAVTPSNNAPVVCNGGTPDFTFDSNTAPSVSTDLTFDVVPHLVTGITATGIANTGVSGITKASLPYHFNSGTLSNSTDSKLIVQYEVIPKLAGCPNGSSQFVSVVVQPTPKVAFTNSAPVLCNGATPNIAFTSPTSPYNTSDLTFDVTVTIPTGVTATGVAGAGLTGVSAPFFINTGVITNANLTHQTVKYFVTPKMNGCANGTPVEVDVEVEPTPQVDLPISNTLPVICNGGTPNITFTTSTVPTNLTNLTFDVTVSLPSGVTGTGVAAFGVTGASAPVFINSGSLTNANNTYQTITYTITPKLNGCPNGTQRTVSIKIEPTPVVNTPTNNTPIICNSGTPDFLFSSPTTSSTPSDLVFDITANIPSGVTGTGLAFTGATGVTAPYELNSGTLTNSNNGYATVTYTITPRIGTTCAPGSVQTVTVQVEPTPTFVFTNSAPTVCNAGTPNISVTTPTTPAPTTNLTFDVVVTLPGGVTGTGVAGSGLVGTTAPFFINSGTLTNSSNTFKTVKYTVTPKLSGCGTGTPQDILVVVEPTPTVSFINNAPRICSGGTPSIDLVSSTVPSVPANLTFDVVATIPSGITGTGMAFTGATGITTTSFSINSGTLTNTTNQYKTVTYTITPKLSGCTSGPVQTVNVIVEPVPVVSFSNNAPTVCNGGTPNILVTSSTSNSTPSDLTFDVTVTLPSGVTGTLLAGNGITGATAPFSINTGVLTNTNTAYATVVYRITPKLNGCSDGTFQDVSVIVEPTPQVDTPVNNKTVICNGDAPSIDVTTSTSPSIPGNLTFDVVVTMPAGVTGTGAAATSATGLSAPFSINSGSLTNSTNSFLTVTYQVTPKLNGCTSGTPKTVTVIVEPTPQATFTNNAPSICTGNAPNISVASPTNAKNSTNLTFDVTVSLPAGVTGTGVAANGLTNAIAPFNINTGTLVHDNLTNNVLVVTYTITPKLGSCAAGPAQQVQVNVRPDPVGVSSTTTAPALDVCSGQSFTYDIQNDNINTLGNQVNSTFTFVVSSSDETNVPTPTSLDRGTASTANITGSFINRTNVDVFITYQITPFNLAGNCAGTPFNVVVTIHPEPYPVASPAVQEICSGVAMDIDLQQFIQVVSGNTLNTTFTYTVTADHPVDLTPAVFPGSFDRSAASTAHITDAFVNRNTNNNFDVTLTYTVTPYSVSENCKGSNFIVKVIVHPEPVGQDLTDNVCATTLNHDIQGQITNGIGSEFIYTVSSDNVGVAAGPARTVYSNAAITDSYSNNTGTPAVITYTITARSLAHGCVAGAPAGTTFTYKVTVFPTPVAQSAPLTGGPFCSDTPFSIDPQTYIANGVTITTYDWTATYSSSLTGTLPPSGTGAAGVTESTTKITGTMINITGADLPITFHITPYSGGCAGTPYDVVVNIHPKPVVSPTFATATICSTNADSSNPLNVTLNTIGGGVAADHYNITLKSQDTNLIGTPTVGNNLAANALAADKYSNTTATALKVVYTVVPVSAAGCSGDPFDVTVTVNPEPVLYDPPGQPAVCSTNDNTSNPVNVVFGTNGTSASASTYQLINIQYNSGSGFSTTLPTGFTRTAGGPAINTSGGINLVKADTYTNKLTGPVTVRYTVQATSAQNCLSTKFDYDVVVNPQPLLSPTTAPVCSGVASGIVLTNDAASIGISQYQLKSITIPSTITASGSNASLGIYNNGNFLAADVFTNTTNTAVIVQYKIVAYSTDGCMGIDQTVSLTVNPAPAVASGLDATVCSNDISGIVLSTDPLSAAVASYNITNIAVQSGLVAASGNAATGVTTDVNYIKNDQFVNNTNNKLTVTYTVVPSTGPAANCVGPAKLIVLTVEPNPTVVVTTNGTLNALSESICSATATSIIMTSPTVPTAGSIVFSYTAVTTSGLVSGFTTGLTNLPQGYTIADNLVNNDNVSHTVTYTITPVAIGAKGGVGCTGTPVQVTVTVEPKPKLVASPAIQTVCEVDAAHPAAVVNIALNSTTVPSSGSVIFEIVGVTPTGGITGYSSLGTTYTNGSAIADALTNPTSTPQTITYTLRPKVTGGSMACVGDDVTVTITVNPRPVYVTGYPQVTSNNICSGTAVEISTQGDVASTITKWTASVLAPASTATLKGSSRGSGDNLYQVLTNTAYTAGVVEYVFTPTANGCEGTPATVDITVQPVPDVVMPITFNPNICYNGTLTLAPTSNVSGTTFAYALDPTPNVFSIPATGPIPFSQVMTGNTDLEVLTFTINPTLTSGLTVCAGTPKSLNVQVAPQLTASILNANTVLCSNRNKDILSFQFEGGQAPYSFVYSIDGVSQAPINGVYGSKSVNLLPSMLPPGDVTTFKIESVNDAFNCSINPAQPAIKYNVIDMTTSLISATPACSPYDAQFAFKTADNIQYEWNWGDGADTTFVTHPSVVATSPHDSVATHQFVSTNPTRQQTYSINMSATTVDPSYTDPNSCAIVPIKVQVNPTIQVNVFPDRTSICSGTTVTFSNQSQGNTTNAWSYQVHGSGASTNPLSTASASYVFNNTTSSNPVVYDVIYEAGNSYTCPVKPDTMQITVYRAITASFDPGTVPPLVGGTAVVTFTNTSQPVDGSQFTYDWDFGDNKATPSTATGAVGAGYSIPVTYTTPGPKDVTLTVDNPVATGAGLSCGSEYHLTININLLPLVAAFQASPLQSCYPSDIIVTDNTSTGDVMNWNLIDGNGRIAGTSQANLPIFHITNPGIYTLSLTTSVAEQPLQAPASATLDNINVYDRPLASFDLRPNIVYVPDTEMVLFNFSSGASNYIWDFGNGDTSTDFAPTYKYKIEGVYNVSLYAQDDHGNGVVCTDTLVHQVVAKQGGLTKIPNAFTPNPNGPNGGVPTNNSFNDVFLPLVKGVEEFNMLIFDRWGNLLFESNDSTIGWDGYDKHGKLLPAGVYVYKLTLRLSDSQRTTQVGDVTLIR